MSDKPFYAPDLQPTGPREPQPGERLWTMTSGKGTYHAELRSREPYGWELQIFRDGELRFGHLHPHRDWAILEASIRQETLRVKGWTRV